MPQQKEGLVYSFTKDKLRVHVYENELAMAKAAAIEAISWIEWLFRQQQQVRIILACAVSQEKFLLHFTSYTHLPWERVTIFHMDEYLGIDEEHPASFRKFIRKHVQQKLPQARYEFICGDSPQPLLEIKRYENLILAAPIDLCCFGIGENAHIAFNDPHVADLEDPFTLKLVALDEICRRQQVKDGAFAHINQVPMYAYTLTIPALVRSRKMIGIVPGAHKAEAVKNALEGPISASCPASALRKHDDVDLFLDVNSAALLKIINDDM